ncbi:hypothetical protein BJX63DRAFT_437008 [Aspergillus granulosus]|uniref:Uncharacterized protein n=1 Tax=Aspergillus granulosus TaxID=176169 RepID=A0ABR4GY27_9EURO
MSTILEYNLWFTSQIVRLSLAHGAELNYERPGYRHDNIVGMPLQRACALGYLEVANALVEYGSRRQRQLYWEAWSMERVMYSAAGVPHTSHQFVFIRRPRADILSLAAIDKGHSKWEINARQRAEFEDYQNALPIKVQAYGWSYQKGVEREEKLAAGWEESSWVVLWPVDGSLSFKSFIRVLQIL